MRGCPTLVDPSADYFMDAVQLQVVNEEKDLGVVVTDDLKWENQCVVAVKQANKVLGMIKRSFTDRTKETIMALYKSLVRPHLELNCTGTNSEISTNIGS